MMKTLLLYLSRTKIYNFAVVLGLVFGNAYAAGNLPVSETNQFRALKKEILEDNCYKCGGSEANLISAIQQLEALVNSGFDLLEPKQLLADSYRVVGLNAERNSQEQEDLLGKYKQLYAELFDEYPHDVDLLLAYMTPKGDLKSPERARLRLRELLADASRISALWLLSASTDADKRERGLELLSEAYKFSTGKWRAKPIIGLRLIEELEYRNLTERADAIKAELREKYNFFRD